MVQEPPPPPKRLTHLAAWFALGMVMFGIAAVLSFMGLAGLIQTADRTIELLVAVVWLGILLGVAVLLMRKGKIALASGLLVGYAVLTITSGGQCTFWSATADYGFAEGFFLYLFALAGAVGLVIVAMIADAIRSARPD